MAANEIIDLYAATVSASVETALSNRLDSSINSIKSSAKAHRRVVGLAVKSANTGSLIGRIEGQPVITICFLLAAALTGKPLDVDIDIPDGAELTFASKSTSGTAYCSVAVLIERKG
jgi:predicted RNA-binding protein YlqC (UPF0109 family)